MKIQDIHRLAFSKDFIRFDTLLTRQALQKMPDFRWCKEATCGSGQVLLHLLKQIHDNSGGQIMTCAACNKKS
jgi:hypothetical protein